MTADSELTTADLVAELQKARKRIDELESSLPAAPEANFLRRLAENSGDVLWAVDTSLHFTYLSPSVTRLLGYEMREALASDPRDYLTPESLETVRRSLAERLAGEVPATPGRPVEHRDLARRMELRHIRKDGSLTWTEVVSWPVRDSQGRIVGFQGASRLIDERKRADEALRESEERLRLALEAASDGCWDLNLATGEAYHSPGWSRMLGFEPDEIAQNRQGWIDLLHPDDREAAVAREDAFLRDESPLLASEFRLRRKDGGYRWVLSRGRVTERSPDGRPLRVVGVHLDITEAVEAKRQILAAKEAAESASRSKSEFLANMSHELRTPLNGIMGMLQLMQETPLDTEQQEFAETALTSCRRLTRLLGDILDLAKVEAGQMAIGREPFSPHAVLGEVRDLFRQAAADAGIDLAVTLDEHVPHTLAGDEQRLRQVLFNLVGNAVKFTRSGRVELDACALPPSAKPGRRLLLRVRDTGIGIPDEMLPRIFEAFAQADGSYTRKYQGAGLGLSIVKRLTGLMGGTLCVVSEAGAGTTIYVSLPFELSDGATAARTVPVRLAPRHGRTALVVEDDAVNSMILVRMLARLNIAAVVAENGAQALAALRERDFDLVLMDIQLPEMDGIKATRAIRALPEASGKADIPVVALTAHTMAGDRERFLAAGMDAYLAKPFEQDALRTVIEGALAGRGQG